MNKEYVIKKDAKILNPFYNRRNEDGRLVVSNPIIDMSEKEFMEVINHLEGWKKEAFIKRRQALLDMIER